MLNDKHDTWFRVSRWRSTTCPKNVEIAVFNEISEISRWQIIYKQSQKTISAIWLIFTNTNNTRSSLDIKSWQALAKEKIVYDNDSIVDKTVSAFTAGRHCVKLTRRSRDILNYRLEATRTHLAHDAWQSKFSRKGITIVMSRIDRPAAKFVVFPPFIQISLAAHQNNSIARNKRALCIENG